MSAIPFTEGFKPDYGRGNPTVRLLVCGGRDYSDKARVYAALDLVMVKRQILVVMHGGAEGADALADEWAEYRGFARVIFPVGRQEWALLGKRAGPLRNARMLTDGRPNAVVAFPGNRGTADMCRQAEEAGLHVWRPYK
jgi:hypothetical protein